MNEPPNCDCQECKSMCRNPCGTTPDEARAIIKAGHGSKLEVRNIYREDYDGLWPRRHSGRAMCAFYTPYGRCALHGTLKPLEGRMAHHSDEYDGLYDHNTQLLETWRNDEAQALVKEWQEKYD